jgi:hypothetical protein
MKSFAARSLGWLDMQGYHLSDEEKRRLTVPLKFSSALCTLFGATFVVTQWAPGLFVLAGTALAGALLPRHPFDYAYGVLLARPLRTGWAPRNTPQRRFACAAGAAMLGAAGAFFVAGNDAVAWIVGLSFVAVAFVVTTTNWCLPSLIYNRLLVRIGLPSAMAD